MAVGVAEGGLARLGAGGPVPLRHPWHVPLCGLRHRLPGTRGLGSFRFLFMNVSSGSLPHAALSYFVLDTSDAGTHSSAHIAML